MRTIRDNLEEAIETLKTPDKLEHTKAIGTVLLDLTQIPNFNPLPIEAMVLYKNVAFRQTVRFKQIGLKKWLRLKWMLAKMKLRLFFCLRKARKQKYGDGDAYIKEILEIIRKEV